MYVKKLLDITRLLYDMDVFSLFIWFAIMFKLFYRDEISYVKNLLIIIVQEKSH